MKPVRVVIDTNVWISTFMGGRLSTLADVLDNGRLRVVATELLLNELSDVMARPKFRKYFPADAATDFIKELFHRSDFCHIGDVPQRCRDPKDDYLLELALTANADLLVSGDKDLLDIGKIGDTAIIPPSAFLAILQTL